MYSCQILKFIKLLTKCLSLSNWTILDVQSLWWRTSFLIRYRWRRHRAAHCLTLSVVSPDINNLGISPLKASTISVLPMLAMHCSARLTCTGLRLDRSFWMIKRMRSLLALINTEMNRYPYREIKEKRKERHTV